MTTPENAQGITSDDVENRDYTVCAIYVDNNQRYGTSSCCANPTEAAANAIISSYEDNQYKERIDICAIFVGSHQAKDISVSQADERPAYERSRAKNKPFTIVFRDFVQHAEAPTAIYAERDYAEEGDDVAAVLAGHLDDVSDQVDWDEVNKIVEAHFAENPLKCHTDELETAAA